MFVYLVAIWLHVYFNVCNVQIHTHSLTLLVHYQHAHFSGDSKKSLFKTNRFSVCFGIVFRSFSSFLFLFSIVLGTFFSLSLSRLFEKSLLFLFLFSDWFHVTDTCCNLFDDYFFSSLSLGSNVRLNLWLIFGKIFLRSSSYRVFIT